MTTIFNDKKCSLSRSILFKILFIIIFAIMTVFVIFHINNFILTGSETLANYYISKHNYKAAEKVYLSSLALQEKLQPSNHYPIARTIGSLADFYSQQFMPIEEEKYLKKHYFYVKKNVFTSSHLSIIEELTLFTMLDEIGKSCMAQGKYAEAENYFRQLLLIQKKSSSKKGNLPQSYYFNLANVKLKQKKYKEAEQLYYKKYLYNAKAYLHKKVYCEFKDDYYVISIFYQNLANYKKAEEYAQKALLAETLSHSGTYSDKAIYSVNLAKIYQKEGKYKEAEKLFKKVIFMDQKRSNRFKICDHYNLASLYKDMKDDKSSEIYLNKALSVSHGLLGLQGVNKNQAMKSLNLVCGRDL